MERSCWRGRVKPIGNRPGVIGSAHDAPSSALAATPDCRCRAARGVHPIRPNDRPRVRAARLPTATRPTGSKRPCSSGHAGENGAPRPTRPVRPHVHIEDPRQLQCSVSTTRVGPTLGRARWRVRREKGAPCVGEGVVTSRCGGSTGQPILSSRDMIRAAATARRRRGPSEGEQPAGIRSGAPDSSDRRRQSQQRRRPRVAM